MSQIETSAKPAIIIQITHGAPLSSGAFMWWRATDRNFDDALREYERDIEYGYSHVAIIRLNVDSIEDRQAVTDWIEKHFDLLAQRRIGRILRKFDRWGERP